jgi:small subunit ribosomal protein S6
MNHYELLALLPATLSADELLAAQQSIRALLEKHGAQIAKQEVWEKRKLAYPVRGARQGSYLLCTFDAEPSSLQEMNRSLTLDRSILRHQIVIAVQKTAKELEEESRRRTAVRERREETEHKEPQPAISAQELDEKLAEILTDDIVK